MKNCNSYNQKIAIFFVFFSFLGSCEKKHAQSGSPATGNTPDSAFTLREVRGGFLLESTFLAMDTIYTLTLGIEGTLDEAMRARASHAFEMARQEVQRVESLMSSHTQSGDVYRLNHASREWVSVDPATLEVVKQAVRVGYATEGAFDITWKALRPLYRLRDPDWRPPTEEQIRNAMKWVDFKSIEMDVQGSRLRFTREGMSLDLGGIAKGYALEKASEALLRAGFPNHIVNGGGDLKVCGKRPDRKWTMGIRSPRRKGAIYKSGTLRMECFALVTSGDYERFRDVDGVRYSHIVDPRTGKTASAGVAGVTVVGSDATLADALATGLLVLGPDAGRRALAHFPGFEALWLDAEEKPSVSAGFDTLWD